MEHLSILNEKDPAGAAGRFGGVGHHEDGLPFPIDLLKKVQELICGPGVQRTCGFICQKKPGICDAGTGHSNPLLLPAGDLIGIFLQNVLDGKLFCQRGQPAGHFLMVHARQDQGEVNVVPQRKGVQ